LNTNAEKTSLAGLTTSCDDRRGDGGGARRRNSSRNGRTPKFVIALPKKHRRKLAAGHLAKIELIARHIQQGDIVAQRLVNVLAQQLPEGRIVNTAGRRRHRLLAVGLVLRKQLHLGQLAVVNALINAVRAHRPIHRVSADAQHLLDLLHQLERIAAEAVQLVNERENRDTPLLAHPEQLLRLLLHALGHIDDHHRAVGGDQRPVRILAEILVAGRIEDIDADTVVIELQHTRRHRNAALLFDLHPVRHRVLLRLARLHRPGEVDRPAVQQQLLRQRRLAGVGVGNDRERPAGI
jgi:hypothetical protein